MPPATATANVFSVSYDNYIPDTARTIRISAQNYDGFATPFIADKDSFAVKTIFTGNSLQTDIGYQIE